MKRERVLVRATLALSCMLTIPSIFIGTQAGIVAPAVVGSQPSRVRKAFRPYGYFSLVGKPPKGFENFDTIQYWLKEDEQRGPDISDRTAGVNETGGAVYGYATISINRQKFVFTTKKVRGVSYKFNGRFLRDDFYDSELNLDRPVLVGTLSKYRRGRRVAEANLKLNYFAGT